MRLLAALGRFNAAHPWSHNDAFAGFVLRHARAVRRRGGTSAVDVGCGTGHLVERLARVFPQVIGIEPDTRTATVASRRLERCTGVAIRQRSWEAESVAGDLIVFVASLHHMPLRSALEQARSAVRPGGRVVVVGVAEDDPQDRVRSVISLVLNPVVGFVRHPRRAAQPPTHMRAPTRAAAESFDEIRSVASEILPGIRMRRRLFWRYTAVWVAPLR